MNYDEKLDLLLDRQQATMDRLAKIESVLLIPAAGKPAPGEPDLFSFVRPDGSAKPYGLGTRMTGPDVREAIKRACHGVNWRGDLVLGPAAADEVWAEIAQLQKGNPDLLEKYRFVDPGFAGLALLTAILDPVRYDGFIGQAKRDSWAGTSIDSFLTAQFAISGGPGIGGAA